MSFQEAAIAIGLLTPLILGVLAFIEKFIHKAKPEKDDAPPVQQGMTVQVDNPYADRLIKELTRELEEEQAITRKLRARLKALEEGGEQ